MKLAPYAKAIAAMIGSGLAAAVALYPTATWIPVAIAVLTPVGVYAIPNTAKTLRSRTVTEAQDTTTAMDQPGDNALISVPEAAASTTRLMRDSIRPEDIPVNGTQIVAVYVNGKFATTPDVVHKRFPGVPVAWIDVIGNAPGGAGVLDIENGDATPETAAHWVAARHTIEAKPVLYVNRSNVTAVFNVMAAHGWKIGVHFRIWIATLDGTTKIPDMTGVVAVQARGSDRTGGNFDESIVYDATWHAAGGTGPVTPPKSTTGLLVTDALEVAKISSTDGGHTWTRQ